MTDLLSEEEIQALLREFKELEHESLKSNENNGRYFQYDFFMPVPKDPGGTAGSDSLSHNSC